MSVSMAPTIESDSLVAAKGTVEAAPRGRPFRALTRRMIPLRLRQLVYHARVYLALWRDYERLTGNALRWIPVIRHFFRWHASLSPGRSPIGDRAPWIVYDARLYITHRLSSAHRVFEYGAGGSTVFFLDRGCEVVTAEHDAAWLENVRAAIPSDARWTCHLEPPAYASEPESQSQQFRSSFPRYEQKSFEAYVRSLEKYPAHYFDVIFVDGRARSDALALAPQKVKPGGMIVLDNAERDRYQNAIRDLEALGWKKLRFAGPGPYVKGEFWDTCVFLYPADEKQR